ncbi:MAG: AAA family ATPase [Oscillospiraceae bacterium]|nr:AAA family ATPase [Oscillospiraceae bacterium]
MKISTIYIKNFGKLKNFRFDLKPGLNMIYGENEAGKTTIMNFIKMMFYGSSSKSSDIYKNIRKRYQPWDGGPMGGFIEFNFLNTNYRIEREFGSSNVSDTVKLWNLDTGCEEQISCKYDVGEQFFGLGCGAFERSVFIGSDSSVIKDTGKEDEITKRLMNFATSCDETVSYEIVRKRLKKAHEELKSKGGKNGSIDKLSVLLSDKTQQLAETDDLEEKKSKDELKYRELVNQYEKKLEYCNKIKLHIREQQIIRQLHTLETQNKKNNAKKDLRNKLDLMYSKISNGRFRVTDEFLDECNEMISRISMLKNLYSEKKAEYNTLTGEISNLRLAERIQENYIELDNMSEEKTQIRKNIESLGEDIDKAAAGLSELSERLKETQIKEEVYNERVADMESNDNSIMINYVLPVSVLFIIVLALLLRNPYVLISAVPIAAVIFITGRIITGKRRKAEKNDPSKRRQPPDYQAIYQEIKNLQEKYTREIEDKKLRIRDLDDKYNETDQKKHELEISNNLLLSQNELKVREQSKLNTKLSDAGSEITTLNINLMTMFSEFRPVSSIHEIEDHISQAQNVLSDIEKTQAVLDSMCEDDILTDSDDEILRKISALRQKLSELTGSSGIKLLMDEQLDALQTGLENTEKELAVLNDSISEMRTRITAAYNISEPPDNIRHEISEIRQKITNMHDYLAGVRTAESVLEESCNEIRQTFGPRLNSKTRKIFSHLTGGKYSEILVSKSLDVNVSEDVSGNIHEWQYLSSGTVEQAYFSVRLAIADMITKNQIPLFLDDVFIQYDSKREEKGFQFISEYSRLNQVLFFTCHRYEKYSDRYINMP